MSHPGNIQRKPEKQFAGNSAGILWFVFKDGLLVPSFLLLAPHLQAGPSFSEPIRQTEWFKDKTRSKSVNQSNTYKTSIKITNRILIETTKSP